MMNKRVTIHTENSIYVIDPDDVLYCRCHDISTTIHLKNNETLEVSKQIDAVEKLLENNGFVSPHHAFLVNRKYIQRVDMADGYTLVLTNQVTIPIEGKAQSEILEFLKTNN